MLQLQKSNIMTVIPKSLFYSNSTLREKWRSIVLSEVVTLGNGETNTRVTNPVPTDPFPDKL